MRIEANCHFGRARRSVEGADVAGVLRGAMAREVESLMMAETIGDGARSRAFMTTGKVAPFVTRFDAGSVAVGYLVLSSETATTPRAVLLK